LAGEEGLLNTFLVKGRFNGDVTTPVMLALLPSNNPEAVRWYSGELMKLADDMEEGVYEDVLTLNIETVEVDEDEVDDE
jgi:hypothetical protein